jgi:hypothetical protein
MRFDWVFLTTTMSEWGHSAWEAHFNRHCPGRRVRALSTSRCVETGSSYSPYPQIIP